MKWYHHKTYKVIEEAKRTKKKYWFLICYKFQSKSISSSRSVWKLKKCWIKNNFQWTVYWINICIKPIFVHWTTISHRSIIVFLHSYSQIKIIKKNRREKHKIIDFPTNFPSKSFRLYKERIVLAMERGGESLINFLCEHSFT